MPSETDVNKVAIAIELSTEILVGILRRRAAAKGMDIGTLLADAARYSQEADQVLDALAAKGHEPTPGN